MPSEEQEVFCQDWIKLADRERPMNIAHSVGCGTLVTNYRVVGRGDCSISWVGWTGSTRRSRLAKVLTVIGVKVWVLLASFPLFKNKQEA